MRCPRLAKSARHGGIPVLDFESRGLNSEVRLFSLRRQHPSISQQPVVALSGKDEKLPGRRIPNRSRTFARNWRAERRELTPRIPTPAPSLVAEQDDHLPELRIVISRRARKILRLSKVGLLRPVRPIERPRIRTHVSDS